ncbi:MAG TPA: shikimate dehydrogenase [Baekduia sp.]|nr:shikimate dehydrogenase [Baekduia sp.]
MNRLGVLGWPVAHSRSPAMHRAALADLGLTDWSYDLLPAAPDALAETVAKLAEEGFVGANVTIPHKEAALALADEATAEATAIGAANTLTFRDGRVLAANTDAPGFLAAIGDKMPAKALVLGAGGSARAVVYALERAGCEVLIFNRTRSRAEALGTAVDAPEPADMLINCTSLGLGDSSSDFKALTTFVESLSTYATVVDLVYREGEDTELIAQARGVGCAVVDGLEILVRQGALSFEIWTGQTPDLDVMRRSAGANPTDDSGLKTTQSSRPDSAGDDRRSGG